MRGGVDTAGKRDTSSHVMMGSSSLRTTLTYLWLLESAAHTCPWLPRCRSGSLCLGEEQDSAEQVPQLIARRSGVVGKYNMTRRGRNLGLHRKQVEGLQLLLPSDTRRQERTHAGCAGRGTGMSPRSSTVRPAGQDETSIQHRHLLPEIAEVH